MTALAEDLRDRGKLDLSERFIDGSFAIAKRGGSVLGPLSGARAARSWQWQSALVFLSPSMWPALRRYAVHAQRNAFDLSPPAAVREEPPSAIRLTLDSPNPSTSGLRLTYGVPSGDAGESYECALFDVSGRKIFTLAKGQATPGFHSLSMDRSGVVGGLRAGHYYVRLVVGRHRLTTHVIILR